MENRWFDIEVKGPIANHHACGSSAFPVKFAMNFHEGLIPFTRSNS